MSRYKIQYQVGLSAVEFNDLYLEEENCRAKLRSLRWPQGYKCDRCAHTHACMFQRGNREMYQCQNCHHQCSLRAGTLISALELHRHLNINSKSAWLMKQKIMQCMYDVERNCKLSGRVEVDDAYLGGKLEDGKRGRGSENKSPFVAAVQTNEKGRPLYAKFTPVKTFSRDEIKNWAKENLKPGSHCVTDGLDCFNVFKKFGTHEPHVISREGKKTLGSHFYWSSTILSNVKTSLAGTFHSLDFDKYGFRYLADIQFRFNRRFNLAKLFESTLYYAVKHLPCPQKNLVAALYG